MDTKRTSKARDTIRARAGAGAIDRGAVVMVWLVMPLTLEAEPEHA